MVTYADRYIEPEDIEIFHQIERVIDGLIVPNLGVDDEGREIELSCHMLAEVLEEIFGLKRIDGYFMMGYYHSWLITTNRNIIDVYPVGMIGGPLLIARQIIHRQGPIYIEDENLDFGQSKPSYKKSLELVRAAVRESIASQNQTL